MPFKPGQSGNPAGKKPGTKHNVSDIAVREFLREKSSEYFFGTGENSFTSDMMNIKPSMRLQMWEKYLKYYLPQLAALAIDANIEQSGTIKIDFGFGDKDVDDAMQGIIANI